MPIPRPHQFDDLAPYREHIRKVVHYFRHLVIMYIYKDARIHAFLQRFHETSTLAPIPPACYLSANFLNADFMSTYCFLNTKATCSQNYMSTTSVSWESADNSGN